MTPRHILQQRVSCSMTPSSRDYAVWLAPVTTGQARAAKRTGARWEVRPTFYSRYARAQDGADTASPLAPRL